MALAGIPNCFSCSAILFTGSLVFAGLGVVSHLLYFIHGELNKQAGNIVVFFITTYTVLLGLCMFPCGATSQAWLVATVFFATYQIALGSSIAVYRLLLHRSSCFPGPKQAALTKWYGAFVARKTQRYHAELRRLHQTYGDIVRTGPRELSINRVDAIKEIYGNNSKCLKGPWYDMGGTGFNLHRTRNPILHAKQRPLWEQGFREMSGHISKIEIKITSLLRFLRSAPSNADVVTIFELFSFKLMAFIIFSQDIDGEPALDTDVSKSHEQLRQSQRAIGTFGHVPWYYSVSSKFKFLIPENDGFTRLATRMIDQRRTINPDVPDLFSYLLPSEKNGEGAGFPMSWEARLAMVAGSGNVSSALISLVFYLAANPNALKQLQDEVDPLLNSGNFNPKLRHPVLSSIMFETFRLQPLVPNGGERVSPPQGFAIGDTFIPGDCVIKVPTYTLFRDERYFARPDEWVPERWSTQPNLVKNPSAFIPFSIGPYSCVGRPLGTVEISLVLAHLVHNFDLQLSEGQNPQDFDSLGQDHFGMTFPPGSLRIDFKSRKRNKDELSRI
ncbi:putative cytochrome P450 [Rosellinia necatrix]|uniref:Putative cytochrome P450 n=1 Tax=Rosellinia necatrix TaxID=77044 RepID=A0A1W2THB7_ROSNE|nr:putative cytochrome P450 [Rosellinia necatrix]